MCGSAVMVQRSSCCTALAQRGDMWGHPASALIEDHLIVVPDLRGLGLSSKPDGGYDNKNQAADVVGVLDALGVRTFELVTHDIGIMVGFAVAATHPTRAQPRLRPFPPGRTSRGNARGTAALLRHSVRSEAIEGSLNVVWHHSPDAARTMIHNPNAN